MTSYLDAGGFSIIDSDVKVPYSFQTLLKMTMVCRQFYAESNMMPLWRNQWHLDSYFRFVNITWRNCKDKEVSHQTLQLRYRNLTIFSFRAV